jgi:hypothetical protein
MKKVKSLIKLHQQWLLHFEFQFLNHEDRQKQLNITAFKYPSQLRNIMQSENVLVNIYQEICKPTD